MAKQANVRCRVRDDSTFIALSSLELESQYHDDIPVRIVQDKPLAAPVALRRSMLIPLLLSPHRSSEGPPPWGHRYVAQWTSPAYAHPRHRRWFTISIANASRRSSDLEQTPEHRWSRGTSPVFLGPSKR